MSLICGSRHRSSYHYVEFGLPFVLEQIWSVKAVNGYDWMKLEVFGLAIANFVYCSNNGMKTFVLALSVLKVSYTQ